MLLISSPPKETQSFALAPLHLDFAIDFAADYSVHAQM